MNILVKRESKLVEHSKEYSRYATWVIT